MKIQIRFADQRLTVQLEDTTAARDFASLLPLELELADYAATEKIASLPRRIDTSGSPAGIDPDVGDVTYYAPWGNLAIFHKDFGYSSGLVRLGRLESGIELLARKGPIKVRVDIAT